ncbi:MAG TPA: sulfur transferase domain-containing protein [Sphingobium sp.]|nr:sulfur transferase domain-containing protein [Sphingobium sp.]
MTDPEGIHAWQRLDARITTSGRLRATDPARLAAIGVRHIVNLALDDHPGALAHEAELCAAAGLRYTHLPVPFDAPDERHFAAFCAIIAADDAPVHVHCIANFRVAAFFCRYHRDVLGMPEGAARALMAQHWTPETHEHPMAPLWAAFIARKSTGETE